MNKFKKLDHIKSVIENSRDSANTNDTNNTQSYKLKLLELKKILDEELEKIYNEEIKKNVTNNLKLYLDTQDVKMNVYSHTEHLGSFANKQEIRIKNLLFKREFYGNILPHHKLKESRYKTSIFMMDINNTVVCELCTHTHGLDISFNNTMHQSTEFIQLFNMFELDMSTHMKKYYNNWNINDHKTQEYFKDLNITNPSAAHCAFLDIVSHIFTELMPSILHNKNKYIDKERL